MRAATLSDVFAVTAMARDFHSASPYASIPFDPVSFRLYVTERVEDENAIFLVEDDLSGFILGLMYPCYFNSKVIVAQELLWWVKPEYRGRGHRLLEAFEETARDLGAEHIICTTTPTLKEEALSKAYERKGYIPAGGQFLKRVA
jgi:GNAT superfamily N-acetyltransferase